MAEWLFFNSFLPLLPIPLTKGGLWLFQLNRGWAALIRDGQVCFYSTSLCAVSFHDFLKRRPESEYFDFVMAALIFFMIFSTVIFGIGVVGSAMEGSAAEEGRTTPHISDGRMGLMSLFSAIPPTIIVVIVRAHWGLLS